MRRPPALLLSALLLNACTNVAYQPAARHGFVLDPAADVDDETIASALDATEAPARPTIPETFRIAYYTFDRLRGDGLREHLATLPGAEGIYQVAQISSDSRETANQAATRSRDYLEQPPQVSLRRLRLLAARARCELLVVADYGYRHSEDGNSWVMTTPLVLPLFFAPMVDVRAESYLDLYVVDVRSGRLIAEVKADRLEVWRELTLFHDADAELLDKQWQQLRAHAEDEITRLFADPAKREQPPPPPPAQAPTPKPKAEAGQADPFQLPANPEEG